MATYDDVIDDLVVANRILSHEGILDGFGHVSARHPDHPDRYLLTRELAAGLVTAADINELDLDSCPIQDAGKKFPLERFIHGEIFKARPDVHAVVHTHAPALVPFGIASTPLRPLFHVCGFLGAGAPVFDIQDTAGMTDMLVRDGKLGHALAESLGEKPIVLMRGHGATVVGTSIRQAVFRAVYAALNAQLQPVAMQLGDPKYLADEEADKADKMHDHVLDRPWNYWKRRAFEGT